MFTVGKRVRAGVTGLTLIFGGSMLTTGDTVARPRAPECNDADVSGRDRWAQLKQCALGEAYRKADEANPMRNILNNGCDTSRGEVTCSVKVPADLPCPAGTDFEALQGNKFPGQGVKAKICKGLSFEF